MAVVGVGVGRSGAALFSPVSGATIAAAVLLALTQRALREYRGGDAMAVEPEAEADGSHRDGAAGGATPATRASQPRG